MVEFFLVLVQTTSTTKNIILSETGMMGIFGNIRVNTQHPPWCYFGVWIIQLVLLIVICLVLLMGVLKVVWFLVPPTLTTKTFIVELMVNIFLLQGLENIHP